MSEIDKQISELNREEAARKEKSLIPEDIDWRKRVRKENEIDRKYGLL